MLWGGQTGRCMFFLRAFWNTCGGDCPALGAHPAGACTHHLLSLLTHALRSCHFKLLQWVSGDIPGPRAAQNTHFTFQRVYSGFPLPNPPTYADAHMHTITQVHRHTKRYSDRSRGSIKPEAAALSLLPMKTLKVSIQDIVCTFN